MLARWRRRRAATSACVAAGQVKAAETMQRSRWECSGNDSRSVVTAEDAAPLRVARRVFSAGSVLLLAACGPSISDASTTAADTGAASGSAATTTASSSSSTSDARSDASSSTSGASSLASSGDAPIDCEARNSQFDCAPLDCAGPFPIWDTGCGGAFVFDDDGCMRPSCHDDEDCGASELCYRETDCDPSLDADGDGCYLTMAGGYCARKSDDSGCNCFPNLCSTVGWCIPGANKPC